MTAIFYRLQAKGLLFPHAPAREEEKQENLVAENNAKIFRKLAENHLVLAFDYNTHCMGLTDEQMTPEAYHAALEDAYRMAAYLEHIYTYYMAVPHLAKRYRDDQKKYQALVAKNEPVTAVIASTKGSYVSIHIREKTAIYNLPRLFTLRLRRMMLATVPFLESYPFLHKKLEIFGQITQRPVAYFGWLYFTPRLINNLFMTAKHIISGPWLDENEASLSLATRLKLQWQRRWFEFGNDAVWAAASFINCFFLVEPYSFYVNLSLQVYDVVLAGIRLCVEINRLNTLVLDYEALLKDPELSSEQQQEISKHLRFLKEKIAHDQRRYLLNLVNTILMVIAIGLACPLLINPIYGVVGGMLGLLTTAIVVGGLKTIEKMQPKDNPSFNSLCETSKKIGFFLPASEIDYIPEVRGGRDHTHKHTHTLESPFRR
ncbi:Uncharacterised protein (plasmid) [Legionella adelaidensis]|uniref:Coiled-coil protein n=1 Tax=Legionella adelaidensis TaxID=45056 RepID=A0A0W0R138_9GAMM|nr:hypothetical protein [Legionella adelaidensis]KTC64683.1 hypothetical protein Lade_1977 [Legionella adelaidensis]VEH86151.1 Uncharacterised protein [Legionella adelaidensis]